MERACVEVWNFACKVSALVVRVVGHWRWPRNVCKNSWIARFGTKEILTLRMSCCDAMISRSWRIELLSGVGCRGGKFLCVAWSSRSRGIGPCVVVR
jgi:hypothetical protein